MRRGAARPGAFLLAAVLAAASIRPATGYIAIRNESFSNPPATWPIANLPLPTLISSAGSDNVPGSADTNAIIAAEQSWTAINTSYFAFAAPVVGTGTALNSTDGKNSIFFDETGAIFGAGSSVIAATNVAFTASTGIITDSDLVFNGTLTFSTATPTPVDTFDIQGIATHELGHMQGLDHPGIVSGVMFPIGADGQQFQRNLDSDDRLGVSALYPESAAGSGIAGLQAGDGDLVAATGSISGFTRTTSGLVVPGAHVVAQDANGLALVSDISRIDGSYLLTGLLPGGYQVFAEPMDGVLIEQDVNVSLFMNAFFPFVTTFLGGNASPTTVTVSAGATSSGNVIDMGAPYGTETESNGTSASANPVALEALTSGLVNPKADNDFFSFPGTTGDIITIDVDSSGDGCPLDPVLTLLSTNGTTQLATNDDFDGKGNDSRVGARLSATGTFFAKVVDFPTVNPNCPDDGPGSFYTIHVNKAIPETENNNTQPTANAAAIGQRRGGVISTASDVDFYSFTVNFGDRILAEVTANRAGSTLNPTLMLLAPSGALLAQSLDIGGGDVDSLIDFTFVPSADIPTLPATVALRVSQAAGAGAGAFYSLNIATDSLNTIYSGTKTLGTGLNPPVSADIFPKFITQGASFDLIVAGEGIPLDPADTITVSGISTFPTAGPDFGSDPPTGLDFLATSVNTASSVPGPHTIFTQNATLKSAMPGGLVVTPSAVPAEAGPIVYDGTQLSFIPPTGGIGTWNVYRGNLPLVDGNADGLADNYGSSFGCTRTSPLAADPAAPAVGGGFFYLVAERNSLGQGSLGQARTNAGGLLTRPASALTPACP
ncbi:MAG TPA: matrixin family metalloprotease [Candidatus Polarisedimenticolia bacterium]|nr:matrixin family metalloprotease [Candidatus Polarisedimenticolia bacterium]